MRTLGIIVVLLGCARPARPPTATPILYFAMTDRFANGDPTNDLHVDRTAPGAYHGGDLRGLTAHLDHIAALGVDLLWISPVVDNVDAPVSGAGFPDWGYHGYWAKDFRGMDEHQGTLDDLRALVAAAHGRGIKVLLDVVLNHPGYGSPLGDDPKWTRSPARGDCGADAITECLLGLPDFRTEDAALADALIGEQVRWLTDSGVDGLRVDSVRHVGLDVWRRLAAAARAARPGTFLLGELSGAAPGRAELAGALATFDALYDFEFADRALAFVTGREDAAGFAAYLERRGGDADRFVTYLNTHDTPGFLHRAGGDKVALVLGATLEMTLPGIPLITYGDEVARPGGEWPANRSDMPWTAADGADAMVLARYRQLTAAHRRVHGALGVVSATGSLLVFTRGDVALIAVNVGREQARVPLTSTWQRATDALGWGASRDGDVLVLPPRSAAILLK